LQCSHVAPIGFQLEKPPLLDLKGKGPQKSSKMIMSKNLLELTAGRRSYES
jgi:hypothetical protein